MKVLLIFYLFIFYTPNLFAESFICLTKNFENKDAYILLNKIDNNTYNFIQTLDIDSDNFNEVQMNVLQDTKKYLTLALAIDELSLTFHLDRVEKYFEVSHISLFVKRDIEKLKGRCIN